MPSGFWLVTRCEPRTAVSAWRIASLRDAALLRAAARTGERPPSAAIATKQVLGADVLVLQPLGFGLGRVGDLPQPRRQARLRAAVRARQLAAARARTARASAAGSAFILRRISGTMPSRCSTSASEQVLGRRSRDGPRGRRAAARRAIASWAFSVYLLMFMSASSCRPELRALRRYASSQLLAALRSASRCSVVSERGSCTSTVA